MDEWKRTKSKCSKWNDNDIDTNYETFIVDRNSSNQQYIIHNFRVHDQQRPIHFHFLCPFEFSSEIDKINSICCHIFNNEHPQYNTHILYEFKVTNIQFNKVTRYLHKKKTPKITHEQFVFYLHHGVQFLTSNWSHYILGKNIK